MPNWCFNSIRLKGTAKDIKAVVNSMQGRRAVYAGENFKSEEEENKYRNEIVYTFNATCPVPQEILDAGYSTAGYHWQTNAWGTKWDALDEAKGDLNEILKVANNYDENELMTEYFAFNSAWSPPLAWLNDLANKYPEVEFEICFEEDGLGEFGKVTFHNHEIEETDYNSITAYRYFEGKESIKDCLEYYYEAYGDDLDKEDFIESVEDEFDWCISDINLKKEYEIALKEILEENFV